MHHHVPDKSPHPYLRRAVSVKIDSGVNESINFDANPQLYPPTKTPNYENFVVRVKFERTLKKDILGKEEPSQLTNHTQ